MVMKSSCDIYVFVSDGTVRDDERVANKCLIDRESRAILEVGALAVGATVAVFTSLFVADFVSVEAALINAGVWATTFSAYSIKNRWCFFRKKTRWIAGENAKKVEAAQKYVQQIREEVKLLGGTSHTHILALANRTYNQIIANIEEERKQEIVSQSFLKNFGALPVDDPEYVRAQQLAEEWNIHLARLRNKIDTKVKELTNVATELTALRTAQQARLILSTTDSPQTSLTVHETSLLADELDGIRHARKKLAI